MKKATRNILVALQLIALLLVQVQAQAPGVARLYPALASGDFGECHCNLECNCSKSSRVAGNCCCKLATKYKLESHSTTESQKPVEQSLRTCPCGSSPIGFPAPEEPEFLKHVTALIEPGFEEKRLETQEPPQPADHLLEPPIPPPRLIFA